MLEVRGLHVGYGARPVVRGIDLDVGEGEAVAVLGRNGTGKTTTMRALAGVLLPERGSIRVHGHELRAFPAERRVSVGVVLVPEGRGVFPQLTVRENLAMGAYHRRLWGRGLVQDFDRVCDIFPRLGERMAQTAGSLSTGEQQMLAIGRGLMSCPHLLLVDEPSLGLAPLIIEQLYGVFVRLRAEGMALIVVEQHVELALSFADRAYVLDNGRVALSGRAADLAASNAVAEVYLAAAHEEANR